MKPLNTRWIVSAYNHLKENTEVVINGFKEAGITQILGSYGIARFKLEAREQITRMYFLTPVKIFLKILHVCRHLHK